MALPTAVAGAPWWAVLACGVFISVAEHLQGLLRDRTQRRLDVFLMAKVDELQDPQDRTRALIAYRQAGAAMPACESD
ncbi:hypothetical protein [Streptomyces xanthochromogenes]|uniref:hypothetical protein n=1 Tax=Streptomyces xanthochromogenes TaxID=67384 RepID=UPI003418FEFF